MTEQPWPSLAQIVTALVELMENSSSDTVRASAAKILLERVLPMTEQPQAETQLRAEVLRAITGLLDELAAARLAGGGHAAVVAKTGTPEPAATAPSLADLAGHGGAGLGENTHRR